LGEKKTQEIAPTPEYEEKREISTNDKKALSGERKPLCQFRRKRVDWENQKKGQHRVRQDPQRVEKQSTKPESRGKMLTEGELNREC